MTLVVDSILYQLFYLVLWIESVLVLSVLVNSIYHILNQFTRTRLLAPTAKNTYK